MARKNQVNNTLSLNEQRYHEIHDAMDALAKVDLAELYAKRFTREAIDVLVDLMHNAARDGDRIRAAMAIIARGWGSPALAIRLPVIDDSKSQRQIEQEIRAAEAAAESLMRRAGQGFALPVDGEEG